MSKNACMVPTLWYKKDCINCWNYDECESYLKDNYNRQKIRKLKKEEKLKKLHYYKNGKEVDKGIVLNENT